MCVYHVIVYARVYEILDFNIIMRIQGPVLKLKSGLEVEEIPEYTEEEEMRDIQTSRPKETDLYLTIDSLKSIAKEDGG